MTGVTSYAGVEDLNTWLPSSSPDPGQDADSLLRSATLAVAWACNRNIYTDVPNATDAIPLRDATCAQAASWVLLGINPADRGLKAPVAKTVKVLTASVENDTTGQAATLIQAAAELAPEARTILLSAGLLYQAAPTQDPNAGCLPLWGTGIPLYGYAGGLSVEQAAATDAYSVDAGYWPW